MKKKILSLFMVIAITIFQFAPTMVSALNYDLTTYDNINSYDVTSDVVTLYVGNISVDGTSTLKYLYTDKSVNTETLTEMKKILTGDYATMLPTTAGQVKVSNDNSVTVQDFYTDAGMVAGNKYPDATVTDTSSTILYNQTQFNSLVSASQTEVSDEKTTEQNNLNDYNTRKSTWELDPEHYTVEFPEKYVNAFKDSTTYPNESYFIADNKASADTSYIIRNGVVSIVKTYPINRTIVKVVNTSANVTTTKYTVTFKDGDTTLSTKEVSEGQKVTPPTNPTKDGYEFMYWSNANGVDINDEITADTIFTANWVRKFKITKGPDQTFYLESDKDITIVADGPFDEFDGFALYFGENGNDVIDMDDLTEGTDYVLEEGSTKLTLKNSFLKTLGADKYYVEFYYYNPTTYGNGYTDTTLTVKTGSEPITTTETTTTDTSSNPQTGDNILFYISMLGLSIIGLAGAGLYTRKRLFNR